MNFGIPNSRIPRKYKKKKTPAPQRKIYWGILKFPRNLLFSKAFCSAINSIHA
ncbi:hypothetical protein [Campylobacter hyointestinalis]|uniref:hypothetical protein n=1 Tax=Campylobacter hyointestinalis TaxID=198 RepID=UPI000B2EC9F8|nr:hypothetical protein [Campylobacter hyointestinalis]